MKLEATAVAEESAFPKHLQVVEEDLDWYFNWSEGELESPSNFSAMVNAIRLGHSTGYSNQTPDDIDNGRLATATKARLIKRALQQLAPIHQRVLFAAFGPNAAELSILGKAAPIAPLTLRAQLAHRESHTTRSIEEWLLRLVHRVTNQLGAHVEEDRANARAIASEATHMLLASMKAFEEEHAISRVQRRG